MRFVWVNENQDPDWAKGDRHAVTGYFMPVRDRRTTPQKLAEIRNRGKVAGLYFAWSWPEYESLAPEAKAAKIVAEYKRLYVPDLRLQYNNEAKDAVGIAKCLREIRRLLPNVGLSWTLEGHQATWLSDGDSTLLTAIKEARVRVVPQLYNGAMTVVFDAITELRKWEAYGVPAGQVSPFHDVKVTQHWDGYGFDQGRLP